MKNSSISSKILFATIALSTAVFATQSNAFTMKQNNAVAGDSGMSQNRIIKVSGNQVNGRNVNQVFHSQGKFVDNGGGNWSEIGNNGGGFNFRENNRDDWSVYLFDASRNVNIQLDIHTKTIYYSDANSGRRPLYKITDAKAPQTSKPQAGINGRNVKTVKYPGGRFKMKSGGRWQEKNNDGKHNFVETGRDDWSVYLTDSSRGVNIQLDLHTKNIYYSDNNTARRVQYKISSVK